MLKSRVKAKLEADRLEMTETQEAILIMYNSLNNGQQKKILKDEKVKKLFDKHGID